MIVCDLCSGRHHTSVCAIGQASIEACLSGTPDDYHSDRKPLPPVVALDAWREQRNAIYNRQRARRRLARRAQ